MNPAAGLSPRADRFAALLSDHNRRRVPLRDLWSVLDQADPALTTDVRRRMILAEVLSELAAAEVIALPSSRSYDRTERPPLPSFVTLPVAVRSSPHRRIVWHPALAWVLDARLTPTQRDHLEAVNRWLHAVRDPTPAPVRERSLEIFGDEKVLNRLIPTSLFAAGRMNLDLLATYRAVVRFTSELVGSSGDLLLVVENCDTFDSLVRVLRERNDHRVGHVGWGAGAAFEASVLSIPRLYPPPTEVAYFGDLDEKGLRIPVNAATVAVREGIPSIRPAAGLYGALLAHARLQSIHRRLSDSVAGELTTWLHPAHREQVIHLLTNGKRVAQEAVGRHYLTTNHDWLTDLR